MIMMMFEDMSILVHVHFLHQCSTNLVTGKFNSLPSTREQDIRRQIDKAKYLHLFRARLFLMVREEVEEVPCHL